MGSRVRIRCMENFYPNIDFEYVFLDLTKNSKSGSHMVGTAYKFSTRLGGQAVTLFLPILSRGTLEPGDSKGAHVTSGFENLIRVIW